MLIAVCVHFLHCGKEHVTGYVQSEVFSFCEVNLADTFFFIVVSLVRISFRAVWFTMDTCCVFDAGRIWALFWPLPASVLLLGSTKDPVAEFAQKDFFAYNTGYEATRVFRCVHIIAKSDLP